MNKEEFIEILNLKHKNAIELMTIKENLVEKTHKRKNEYAVFLYKLKHQYLEKANQLTMNRLKYIFGLKRKK